MNEIELHPDCDGKTHINIYSKGKIVVMDLPQFNWIVEHIEKIRENLKTN